MNVTKKNRTSTLIRSTLELNKLLVIDISNIMMSTEQDKERQLNIRVSLVLKTKPKQKVTKFSQNFMVPVTNYIKPYRSKIVVVPNQNIEKFLIDDSELFFVEDQATAKKTKKSFKMLATDLNKIPKEILSVILRKGIVPQNLQEWREDRTVDQLIARIRAGESIKIYRNNQTINFSACNHCDNTEHIAENIMNVIDFVEKTIGRINKCFVSINQDKSKKIQYLIK